MPVKSYKDEWMAERFQGVHARIDANMELILQEIKMFDQKFDQKLNSIDNQTKKTNGRVSKLEEDSLKIREDILVTKNMKKFIFAGIGMLGTLAGIFWIIFQILE